MKAPLLLLAWDAEGPPPNAFTGDVTALPPPAPWERDDEAEEGRGRWPKGSPSLRSALTVRMCAATGLRWRGGVCPWRGGLGLGPPPPPPPTEATECDRLLGSEAPAAARPIEGWWPRVGVAVADETPEEFGQSFPPPAPKVETLHALLLGAGDEAKEEGAWPSVVCGLLGPLLRPLPAR